MDTPLSRRSLISGLVGGAVGLVVGGTLRTPAEAIPPQSLTWPADPVVSPEAMQRSAAQKNAFRERANIICLHHGRQTTSQVQALKTHYSRPLIGRIQPWELMERLALCVDPTDLRLGCTSQYMHVMQILQAMSHNGLDDEDMHLVALLHDMGKVMLLHGAPDDHVVGLNTPIGEATDGQGFDNCVFQYGHDEFAYQRLKDYVPDHVSWTIRYHSIYMAQCRQVMNAEDRARSAKYLEPFMEYDNGTKSLYTLPTLDVKRYRALLERHFPKGLLV